VKLCPRCGIDKPAHDYARDKSRPDGMQRLCRLCDNRKARDYYAANKEHVAKYNRIHKGYKKYQRLKQKYNLSDVQYDSMLIAQDGKCLICERKDIRSLSVDHDHACCPGRYSCGKCVRGLLCSRCNRGIGTFQDDVEIICKALDYLMSYQNKIETRLH
jgi:hypothetical protein